MIGHHLLPCVLRSAAAVSVLGLVAACCGCGQATTDDATTSGSAATETAGQHSDADGHSHDGEGEAGSAMAKLSDEDRALAEAQKVCVVSGEPLGSMGTPYKVEHDGEIAFLCCEGCVEAFQSDPATYLAKLKGDATGGDGAAEPADAGDEPAADPPAEGN